MIKRVVYKSVIWTLLVGLCGCTDRFRDLNTDKTGITDNDLKIDFNHLGTPLNVIQQGIYFNYEYGKGRNWPFQLMQNLNADMFSGYMHDYKPFNGGSHNSDYNMQDGWNGLAWENTYAYIFTQIRRSEDSTRKIYPSFHAIAKILKVEVMHRISDYYGPIIYSHSCQKENKYEPDSQQEAYYAFFNDLDTAVVLLIKHLEENPRATEFKRFDILLDGEYATWIKFANSLRLRLAIRIAMAAPEKARTEYLKALNNDYNVFENYGEIVTVSGKNGYTNPLGEINLVWGESFMNASMESILNGYQDPRMRLFFRPCPEDLILKDKNNNDSITIPLKGLYKGVRQGTVHSHTLYASHSKVYVTQATPPILMTAAEVWFLRAEAALRGWSAEDPETCYKNGVKSSFAQWGASDVEQYLQNDRTGADYIDAFTASNNIKARCRVSPRWIETADRETKLEKIITQKWLAIFPEGCEAWAEQRRTGYPRLFPVKVNNSKNGCIDTETMVRRLSFPGVIIDTNKELYDRLSALLGGPDNPGTRLWWDTGRNFADVYK